MNNRPHLDRKAADTLYRNHFGAFVYAAFGVVNPGLILTPNWHIDCVCHHLQLMAAGLNARRTSRRAVSNLSLRRWPCRRGCWVEIPAHG